MTVPTIYANISGATVVADDLTLGSSGTPGSLTIYPDTELKGALVLDPTDNAGNTTVTITNAEHGQGSTYKCPDV